MKALIISPAHPAFSTGDAQTASWALFEGLRAQPNWHAHYLAGIGPPVMPHKTTPFMSLGGDPDETFYHRDDFDEFGLGSGDVSDLMEHFERFLRQLRPDVVNFHHVRGFGVQAIRAVRRVLGDVPIVYTLHDYLPICAHGGRMTRTGTHTLCTRASPSDCGTCFPEIGAGNMLRREIFVKSFLAEVDAFVASSHFLLSRFAEWGLPQDKLVSIDNGLPSTPVIPPRPAAEGTRRNRFACFGPFEPSGGVDLLVDAVSRVPAEVWGDGLLHLCGADRAQESGDYQARVAKLLRAAGDRVRICQDRARRGLMHGIDWMVVPSTWWETSPVIIQEAFHHGRPVIASDIGSMAEKVQHDIDGLHFRTGSAESLADRMAEAIADPALWERLRAGIRPPTTAEEAGRDHVQLFAQLLARRQPMLRAV